MTQILIDNLKINFSTTEHITCVNNFLTEFVEGKPCEYPAIGEEAFISRLLDSTTAKEAVDELAKKIFAEQDAEE